MGKYDELVERLKAQAESASRASIALAEAKSARQGDNPEGALDLYEWLLPAETIEWQAAAAIATLEAELETLRPQVKVADDQWDAKCDELAAMKARGDRLAEALDETPVIGRTEHSDHFRLRQDTWLNTTWKVALTEWRDQ